MRRLGQFRQSNDSCRGPLRWLMSRPNLNSIDFMGLFRTGLMACLVVGSMTFAQQPATPGVPAPTPGVPDTSTPVPAPAIPQPEATPVADPSLVQPAPDATTATPAATAKPKAKKPAAPALPTLRGTVASIDKTNMAVVIHGKSKDETLSITSKTRIFADNKPAILSDAKEGENVIAEYHNTKEKTKEALTLRFGGAGKTASASASGSEEVEHKKPAVKPATKKSTKAAAAKKKKNATPIDNAAPAPTDTGVTPIPTPDAGVPVPAPTTPAPTPGVPGTPGTNS